MKSYEKFKEEIQEKLVEHFPNTNYKITISKTMKVNQVSEALNMYPICSEQKISPTYYLEEYYKDYSGYNMDSIVQSIADDYIERMGNKITFNIEKDFNDNIFFCVVHTGSNQELLNNSPHRQLYDLDLSIIYRFLLSEDEDGITSSIISNQMMERNNLTEEEMYQYAFKNTKKLFPYFCIPMMDMVMGLLSEKEIEEFDFVLDNSPIPMYVVSNKRKTNGSSCMIYLDTFEKVAEIYGDLYVIPSSIHEAIIVPFNTNVSPTQLMNMIYDINQNMVAKEEKLSNSLYVYKKDAKKLEFALESSTPLF